MTHQHASEFFHGTQTRIEIMQLPIEQIVNSLTLFRSTSGEQAADLVQRETQLLCLFDKLDSFD